MYRFTLIVYVAMHHGDPEPWFTAGFHTFRVASFI